MEYKVPSPNRRSRGAQLNSSTVEQMQRDAVTQQLKAPAMHIIGNVASSAAELQWFGRSVIACGAA